MHFDCILSIQQFFFKYNYFLYLKEHYYVSKLDAYLNMVSINRKNLNKMKIDKVRTTSSLYATSINFSIKFEVILNFCLKQTPLPSRVESMLTI